MKSFSSWGGGEGSNKFFCYIDKSLTLEIFEDTQK